MHTMQRGIVIGILVVLAMILVWSLGLVQLPSGGSAATASASGSGTGTGSSSSSGSSSGSGSAPSSGSPTSGQVPTIDIHKPPPGYAVDKPWLITVNPGDKWPVATGVCTDSLRTVLVTSMCPGSQPGIVNGGGFKCSSGGFMSNDCHYATNGL